MSSAVAMLNPTPGVMPLGDGVACLSESRGMELRPLALYLMLDSSGSMDEVAGSRTKWQSVQSALRGFLVETRESDLQLGLQFFPLLKAGSSFVCTSNADCGPDGGPCFLKTCLMGGTITLCETDADCPGGDPTVNPCVDFGLCSESDPLAPLACVLPSTCANGLGTCEDFERTCTNATSCDSTRYGTPAVEIQPVSAAFQAIDQALTAKLPEGLTPTVPALQGSLDHARAWALTHPNQNVAVVLVTDGLPTQCDTPPSGAMPPPTTAPIVIDQVLQIAAAGVAESVPIRTHVIAAFQPGDGASINNVNAIAAAGGTEKAAFIDTTGQVEQQFLEALRSVKDTASPCRLELASTDGLDFNRADLLFDGGNGMSSPLPYVERLLGCAASPEGWYYDTPPAQGTPHAVELCPNVCQLVKAAPAAGLSLELGCTATN